MRFVVLVAILFVVSFLGCLSRDTVERGTALVQETTPAERATFQTDRMTLALNLSEKQQARIYAINMNIAARMEAIVLSSAASSRKGRKARQLMAEKDVAFQKVLSVPQYKLYQQQKQELEGQLLDMRDG